MRPMPPRAAGRSWSGRRPSNRSATRSPGGPTPPARPSPGAPVTPWRPPWPPCRQSRVDGPPRSRRASCSSCPGTFRSCGRTCSMTCSRSHREAGAAVSFVTVVTTDPGRLGRVIRDDEGQVERIVEARDATEDELEVDEINSGLYAFDAAWLRGRIRDLRPVGRDRRALPDRAGRPGPGRRPARRHLRGRRRRDPRRDQRPGPAGRGDLRPPGPDQRASPPGRGDDGRSDDRPRGRPRVARARRDPRAERDPARLDPDRLGDPDRGRQPDRRLDDRTRLPDPGQRDRVVRGRGRGPDRPVFPSPAGQLDRPGSQAGQLRRGQEQPPRRRASSSTT